MTSIGQMYEHYKFSKININDILLDYFIVYYKFFLHRRVEGLSFTQIQRTRPFIIWIQVENKRKTGLGIKGSIDEIAGSAGVVKSEAHKV